eukprot:m.196975 g.196975  ORF g.196975 m.196975 type:complete len:1687 (+) comp17019_c0_seq1:60-5120(+)
MTSVFSPTSPEPSPLGSQRIKPFESIVSSPFQYLHAAATRPSTLDKTGSVFPSGRGIVNDNVVAATTEATLIPSSPPASQLAQLFANLQQQSRNRTQSSLQAEESTTLLCHQDLPFWTVPTACKDRHRDDDSAAQPSSAWELSLDEHTPLFQSARAISHLCRDRREFLLTLTRCVIAPVFHESHPDTEPYYLLLLELFHQISPLTSEHAPKSLASKLSARLNKQRGDRSWTTILALELDRQLSEVRFQRHEYFTIDSFSEAGFRIWRSAESLRLASLLERLRSNQDQGVEPRAGDFQGERQLLQHYALLYRMVLLADQALFPKTQESMSPVGTALLQTYALHNGIDTTHACVVALSALSPVVSLEAAALVRLQRALTDVQQVVAPLVRLETADSPTSPPETRAGAGTPTGADERRSLNHTEHTLLTTSLAQISQALQTVLKDVFYHFKTVGQHGQLQQLLTVFDMVNQLCQQLACIPSNHLGLDQLVLHACQLRFQRLLTSPTPKPDPPVSGHFVPPPLSDANFRPTDAIKPLQQGLVVAMADWNQSARAWAPVWGKRLDFASVLTDAYLRGFQQAVAAARDMSLAQDTRSDIDPDFFSLARLSSLVLTLVSPLVSQDRQAALEDVFVPLVLRWLSRAQAMAEEVLASSLSGDLDYVQIPGLASDMDLLPSGGDLIHVLYHLLVFGADLTTVLTAQRREAVEQQLHMALNGVLRAYMLTLIAQDLTGVSAELEADLDVDFEGRVDPTAAQQLLDTPVPRQLEQSWVVLDHPHSLKPDEDLRLPTPGTPNWETSMAVDVQAWHELPGVAIQLGETPLLECARQFVAVRQHRLKLDRTSPSAASLDEAGQSNEHHGSPTKRSGRGSKDTGYSTTSDSHLDGRLSSSALSRLDHNTARSTSGVRRVAPLSSSPGSRFAAASQARSKTDQPDGSRAAPTARRSSALSPLRNVIPEEDWHVIEAGEVAPSVTRSASHSSRRVALQRASQERNSRFSSSLYSVPLTTPQQFVMELVATQTRLPVVPEMCGRLSMLHSCTRLLPKLQAACQTHTQPEQDEGSLNSGMEALAVHQYLHGLVHFHAGILLTRTATFVNDCFKHLLLHNTLKHITIEDRLRPVTSHLALQLLDYESHLSEPAFALLVERLWRRVLDLLLRTLAPEPGAVFRLSPVRATLLSSAAQHLISFFTGYQPKLCPRVKLEGAMSNTMLVLWMLQQPTPTLIGLYHRLALAQLDGEGVLPTAFDPNRWCSPESSRETVRARLDSTRSSFSSTADADLSMDVVVFSQYNGASLSPALSQRYAAILAPFVLVHQLKGLERPALLQICGRATVAALALCCLEAAAPAMDPTTTALQQQVYLRSGLSATTQLMRDLLLAERMVRDRGVLFVDESCIKGAELVSWLLDHGRFAALTPRRIVETPPLEAAQRIVLKTSMTSKTKRWGVTLDGKRITAVEPESLAAKAGVRPDSLILEINGRDVRHCRREDITQMLTTPLPLTSDLAALYPSLKLGDVVLGVCSQPDGSAHAMLPPDVITRVQATRIAQLLIDYGYLYPVETSSSKHHSGNQPHTFEDHSGALYRFRVDSGASSQQLKQALQPDLNVHFGMAASSSRPSEALLPSTDTTFLHFKGRSRHSAASLWPLLKAVLRGLVDNEYDLSDAGRGQLQLQMVLSNRQTDANALLFLTSLPEPPADE